MFKHTTCLIKNNDRFLLLNRNKQPSMGVWNGVGGKIEENETPEECVIRETYEETGIHLENVTYVGNVVLESEYGSSGIYVFISEISDGIQLKTPVNIEEGILDWKSIEWILDENNQGIISHLKRYLPLILEGKYGLEHIFYYNGHSILDYKSIVISKNEIHKKYKI
ncbi:NUDIX hydrolase [Bacillus cytotoxicus]|uniref:NUDIX hydrolase n=1 Tax=Bacillus cytotoxicus (strain DSM 22905 / CIP 110041 / 391-98 / NVH 391-98) TaxID=315749 RepID=A7GPT8_BACCN|nr:8-oxo-dGTP diphosphatase [Bacillus cytotoxicus]ABS22146.1 NUDIX hydrolase [Bacillus cytotoxicus NVH 391-98]AWC32765.1 8-oxo-dGTP diphosphatase [Bacillus cytotoxicus]AWC36792.1 8-oxo-dGTP diphosphatase [Bacillus cytotoxicus]AWC44826.1 8-oxo-dGTP diphosphatase [Bacillus cytotoxicus]AWC61051.1 8-oxo-dGTP diphosphatase [Bacillus cytotoxicus]